MCVVVSVSFRFVPLCFVCVTCSLVVKSKFCTHISLVLPCGNPLFCLYRDVKVRKKICCVIFQRIFANQDKYSCFIEIFSNSGDKGLKILVTFEFR